MIFKSNLYVQYQCSLKNRFLTGVTIHDGGSCYHDGVILPDKVVVITCQFYTNWSICVFAGFFVLSQTKKKNASRSSAGVLKKKERKGRWCLSGKRKKTYQKILYSHSGT